MTKTKHTPAPWHVDPSDDVYVQIPHPSAEGRSYAIRCIPELCQSADSQDYANARLIASAPELRDCLESLLREVAAWRGGLNTLKGFKNMNDAKVGACFADTGRARKVLAKAEGIEP